MNSKLKTRTNDRTHIRLTAVLLATCTGLFALPSTGLPEDADAPIVIRADAGQFDQKTNKATYNGNVQVDQGTLRVNADRMVVDRQDQKVTSITFYGAPATYKQQLNANDDVVRGRANTITYYTQDEVLNLDGQAFLTQQGNEVRGDSIKYDIVAGRVNADSKPDSGPIQIVIPPDPDRKRNSKSSSR